ncbi:MAG: OmpA family protein [Pseudomonadota bacterium]
MMRETKLLFAFLAMLLAGAPGALRAQDLGTVLFDFDSAIVTQSAQEQIAEIAAAIAARPPYNRALIVGYTDAVGAAGYNQNLGQRRADAVAAALRQAGITVDRIGPVESRGEQDLVVMVGTAERRNRRVRVSLQDMLAACPSYRTIPLSAQDIGPVVQDDLASRLATAAASYQQFQSSGQNGPAFQMAGAARHDCGIATALDADAPRKVEYGQRCLCNFARLQVALR